MSILKAIGTFVSKEVQSAEKTVSAAGAFLKKEEPKVETLLNTAIADYKAIQAAVPVIETDLQAVAIFIADLMAA